MGPLRPSGLGHMWKGETGLALCLALRPASVPGPSPWECPLVLEVVETTASLLGSTCDCLQVTACASASASTRGLRAVPELWGVGIPDPGARRGLGVHGPTCAVHTAATPAWDGERSPQGPGWEGRAGRWALLSSLYTPCILFAEGPQGWLQFPGPRAK